MYNENKHDYSYLLYNQMARYKMLLEQSIKEKQYHIERIDYMFSDDFIRSEYREDSLEEEDNNRSLDLRLLARYRIDIHRTIEKQKLLRELVEDFFPILDKLLSSIPDSEYNLSKEEYKKWVRYLREERLEFVIDE